MNCSPLPSARRGENSDDELLAFLRLGGKNSGDELLAFASLGEEIRTMNCSPCLRLRHWGRIRAMNCSPASLSAGKNSDDELFAFAFGSAKKTLRAACRRGNHMREGRFLINFHLYIPYRLLRSEYEKNEFFLKMIPVAAFAAFALLRAIRGALRIRMADSSSSAAVQSSSAALQTAWNPAAALRHRVRTSRRRARRREVQLVRRRLHQHLWDEHGDGLPRWPGL